MPVIRPGDGSDTERNEFSGRCFFSCGGNEVPAVFVLKHGGRSFVILRYSLRYPAPAFRSSGERFQTARPPGRRAGFRCLLGGRQRTARAGPHTTSVSSQLKNSKYP